MRSSTIFISYRREDTAGYAGRLFDRLADKLGRDHVFRDIENIAPGDNFVDAIRKRLAACDVLLVLIGPRWLSATDQHGQKRLEDPNDLVRMELEFGLEQKLRIIPVLLPGTSMPDGSELPDTLAALAQINATEVREPHFDHDVAELIKALQLKRGIGLREVRMLKYRYVLLVGGTLAIALAAVFWLNSPMVLTAEGARLRLAAMGLDYDASTLVHRANEGDSAAVKLFLRAGIDVDETPFNETAIVAATEEGHLKVVRALAEAGANVNPATVAAGRGKSKAVLDYLLTQNPKKESVAGALHVAAGEGNHIDYVKDLLDRGVDVDSDWGGTPLMSAAYYGRLDILRLLIERGADVKALSKGGETALHYAARAISPSIQIIGTLLGSGALLNVQDRDGRTPLMNALDSREVTQMLLVHGGGTDVKLRTKEGDTLLLYAAGRNLTWLVKPLIDRGAELNTQNARGETPLMWATGAIDSVDKPEMAQMLIDNGADVNASTRDGKTALMFAAQKGLASSIRTLLREHAQLTKKDKGGKTALDIARESGRDAIVKLLSGR